MSNISFGLPQRELINTSFLTLAMSHGLDLPIINPNLTAMTDAIDAFNVLYNRDVGSVRYIERHNAAKTPEKPPQSNISLEYAVENGLKQPAGDATKFLLEAMEPLDIINTILIPALDRVGNAFESGKLFLPQLIQSATAAQSSFDVIKSKLLSNGKPSVLKGKIILATVKGDVHDIGKNIVKVILENYGYEVIDLGKDVPIETVVQETLRTGAKLVGLSALMTTTVPAMERTIRLLRERGLDCRVMVGGAVLTQEYADEIGADFYGKDAMASVRFAQQLFSV